MALHIFIVEDEPIIAATMNSMLTKHAYKVIDDCDNVADALHTIKKRKPDLVLIDIKLEGSKDGIDLALCLDELRLPYIFITSQTDPTTTERVKQTHPIGYIAKPFTENGLISSLKIIWNNYQQADEKYLYLTINSNSYKIKHSHINYLQAVDNYCFLYHDDTRLLVPKTLKYVSELLDSRIFQRCHRSFVVNIHKIRSIQQNKLLLVDASLPLSESFKNTIRAILHS